MTKQLFKTCLHLMFDPNVTLHVPLTYKFNFMSVCVGRQEIKLLQSENEELLRNVRVSESSYNGWTDAAVVKDLTVMLAYGDEIDEEFEAERGRLAVLKDQVKCVFHGSFTESITVNCNYR